MAPDNSCLEMFEGVIFSLTTSDYAQSAVQERPLKPERLLMGYGHPCLNLFGFVRISGIAFGCTAATTSFASVVKNPNSWCSPSTGLALVPRTPIHEHFVY